MKEQTHIPVLLKEVIAHFKPNAGDTLLDATLGLGGHTKAFLEHKGTKVVGLDADKNALNTAKENLAEYKDRVTFINSNFGQLKEVLEENDITTKFSHILFDLGIGSHQLADAERGFSFQSEGELTMKFGEQQGLPESKIVALNTLTNRINTFPDVLDIIQGLSAEELMNVIRTYGEEKYAKRIANAITENVKDITTAEELSNVIKNAIPKQSKEKIHPSTRTFLALRLAVNRELEVLEKALPQAVELLKPDGVLAVISFHSLEDRITKQYFKGESRDCICQPAQPICTCSHKASITIKTKKPITASEKELKENPRARSAKLRIAIKKE